VINAKNIKFGVVTVLVLLGMVLIYRIVNKRSPVTLPLPDGVDLPSGWSAVPVVVKLRAAMPNVSWYNPSTYADDETQIWNALDPLNDAQLIAVFNEWDNREGEPLTETFQSNLSGEDLNRALSYFNGLI